jgi:hypothetical protein
VKKGELAIGRHHEQTVGLGHATSNLRKELRPCHPDRDRQTDPLENIVPQPHGDLRGCARDPLEPADVEERLVDRQALHQRGRVVEHAKHSLARLGIGRHARPDHDHLRAESASSRAAHRCADAVGLGLVAGREHDAPADDHGAAAQAGIVSLLD